MRLQQQQKFGLTAAGLRWLAILLMLTDHVWIALAQPQQFWMTCVGRLAFPIFAFLIAEGVYHTSSFKKYALRLLGCGILSEIPYNLFTAANFVNPNRQNIFFTLLAGLLCLKVLLWAKEHRKLWRYVAAFVLFAVLYQIADRLQFSYGGLGVTMVVTFGLAKGLKREKLLQAVCLLLINTQIPGRILMLGSYGFSIQNFATLSLLPIWLYDGRRGPKSKVLQYSAYLFYPVHLGILVILRRFL